MELLERLLDRLTPPPRAAADDELARALRGPSVAEARDSLRYWQDRLQQLPRRRLAARREARAMVARWRERVDAARLECWRDSAPYRLAGALGIDQERLIGLARRRARTGARVAGLALMTCSAAMVALTAAIVLSIAGV